MPDPLPPLSAVRVFEAAARHLSFTRAADELGMTQAAVSYQIKLLEERIGAALFLRRPREVQLTDVGQHLAPEIGRGFEILRGAFSELSAETASTLTVNTLHTFAAQWLAPRLGRFQLAHPNIAVRLETEDRLVDFAKENVDVAVRGGFGTWPGLAAHRLLPVRFTPMLSPAAAAAIGGVHTPEDILKLPLLDPQDPWWPLWLDACGLDRTVLAQQNRSLAGAAQLIAAASAMAGHGVALLTPDYYATEIAAGRLLQPFEKVIETGSSYWLVYPETRRNAPKLRAFRDWILQEAAA